MSSLRLAIKLSMAENKDSSNPPNPKSKSEDEAGDIPVGRKRKHSADFKEARKKPHKEKSLSTDSVDQVLREDTMDSRDDQDSKSGISKSLSASNVPESVLDESDSKEEDHPTHTASDDEDEETEEPIAEQNEETRPDEEEEEKVEENVEVVQEEVEGVAIVAEFSGNEAEKEGENELLIAQSSIDESIDDRGSEMALAPSESFEQITEGDSGIVPDVLVEGSDPSQQPSGQKKRKKRTPSMLRDLEVLPSIAEGESATNGNEADNEDNTKQGRYQSSRTAAKVAKSKFSTGKASRSASNDGTTTGAKSGKKGHSQAIANETVVQAKTEWIQCDECQKWRSIPPSAGIDIEHLPEKWFCTMNTWDTARNTCEAEEEVYNTTDSVTDNNNDITVSVAETEISAVATAVKEEKATPSAKGKGKGKGKKVSVVESEDIANKAIEDSAVPASNGKDLTASGRKRGGGAGGQASKNVSNRSALSADGSSVQAVNWVQCNKCKKWRKAPNENFPEKWFCSLNTWNPMYASCSVRQEEDDTTAENNILQQTPHKGGGKKGAGGGAGGASANTQSNSAAAAVNSAALANASTSVVAGGAVVKKISWVQCERKGCKKWRKVPASIDIDTLPEKWYCEMNTWNSESASCDAPEDVDSDAERNDNEPRNQFILSGPKGPTALSYRRIIFGNDGKMKACFSDKNKNGYGLFSYNQMPRKPLNGLGLHGLKGNEEEEEDEHVEPMKKIAYWWSSAYEDRLYSYNHLEANTLAHNASSAPAASTYLLDTARRIYDVEHEVIQPKHTVPKKIDPAWAIVQAIPLFTRCKAECSVIRSAFLALGQSQLSLNSLVQGIGKCRFLNPIVEACRQYMTVEAIRDALHRLEEADEVDIAFSPNYEMIISLLLPLATLRTLVAARSKVFHRKENKPTFGAKWAKHGVPLKLRKFYVKQSAPVGKRITPRPTDNNPSSRFGKEAAAAAASSDESDYENSRLEYKQNEEDEQQDGVNAQSDEVPTVDAVENPEDFQRDEDNTSLQEKEEDVMEEDAEDEEGNDRSSPQAVSIEEEGTAMEE